MGFANQRLLPNRIKDVPFSTPENRELERDSLVEIGATAPVFAHAVANPLGGISTMIQLLRKHLTDDKDQFAADLLQECSGEIERLTSLLNEFRSLSCPIRLRLGMVDLVKTIRGSLKAAIADHQGAIEVLEEFEAGLPAVPGDAEKLMQAFVQLCKNAAETMPQGGRLMLRAKKLANCVIVEIQYTGCGSTLRDDIFEPFKTPAGVGLAIARRIVRVHGGTISHWSESGKGTTFQLVFPV